MNLFKKLINLLNEPNSPIDGPSPRTRTVSYRRTRQEQRLAMEKEDKDLYEFHAREADELEVKYTNMIEKIIFRMQDLNDCKDSSVITEKLLQSIRLRYLDIAGRMRAEEVLANDFENLVKFN